MSFLDFLKDPIAFISQWFSGLLQGWGLSASATQVIGYIVGGFVLATGAMVFVILLIWVERKIVGRFQDRLGPNRIGPWGIFQTIADMLKIFTKEHITPAGAEVVPFNIAPVLAVGAVLMIWAVIPFGITFYGTNLNVGLLYIVAVGALGEMAVVMAGWGSNNKYALLGAFRAVGQLISYSVPMALALLVPVMLTGSMSMNDIVAGQDVWYVFVAPVAALIFLITSIAEVGRAPFDLVEAESELVAGFNVEYSGLKFGMFYVGDFLHAFTISLLFATLFLGGWRGPGAEEIPILGFIYLFIKTGLMYFINIWLRGSLPRFRIDQMMDLNWKVLTPLALVVFLVTSLTLKLTINTPVLIRLVIMWVLNGAIIWVTGQLLNRYDRRRSRPEVGSRSRPVARPKPVEAASGAENGGNA